MTLSRADQRLIAEPPDLHAELRTLLSQIPVGRVASFGDLAEALGDLVAARWVATELLELDPEEYPVHRVIRRTGLVPGTSRFSLAERLARLRREGVSLRGETVDPGETPWTDFSGTQPLVRLRELQVRIAEKVEFPPLGALPDRIAGVDVSYASDQLGIGAYTIVETRSGNLLHHETIAAEVGFPYIPGYLSFRELPIYGRLLEQVRPAGRLEPWLLVDGTGILHPRRAGIATMLGCCHNVRTVGVSKHLLCGTIADRSISPAEIRDKGGMLCGYCLNRGSKRSTLYVCPGTGVDVPGALRLTESVLLGHRLPEPLHHADRLSRDVVRSALSERGL